MQIDNLFPVPVFSTFLNVDLEKLQGMVYGEEEDNKKGRNKSGTGYQTEDRDYEKYKFLFDQIFPHTVTFFKEFGYEGELFLDNFWFNINRYKEGNKTHSHPCTSIAGVFYVKTPENCGNIVFENPNCHIDWTWTEDRIKERNPYNHQSYFFNSKENLLLMFPSYLRHYVNMNKSQEDRISMAFNLGCRQINTNKETAT